MPTCASTTGKANVESTIPDVKKIANSRPADVLLELYWKFFAIVIGKGDNI